MTALGGAAIAEDAPAKINLCLRVVGRRADGYHLLDSLVVFAGVGDAVVVREHAGFRFTAEGPFASEVPLDSGNLVVAAASGLAERLGRRLDVAIHLTKRLPVASGIGGGSADAAATLRALARLWGVPAGSEAVVETAVSLGADVPMCLQGRACRVGGIGEVIAPVTPLPAFALLLVNPLRPLPTPAVFARRRGAFSPPATESPAHADFRAFIAWLSEQRNDLTEPARAVLPLVDDVLDAITDLPGVLLARMSGSGATCFGACADLATATRAAEVLAKSRPDWWIAPAPVLG